jgi:AcrR family transcriptional regulator
MRADSAGGAKNCDAHFQDKEELFLAVLHERVQSFGPLQAALSVAPGANTVRDNLVEVVRAAAVFYTEGFPMNASIFSEPTLLVAHRAALARRGAGPQNASGALADYVRAEQRLGRIGGSVDASAVAALLIGACLHYGFLSTFHGRTADAADVEHLAASTVDTLLTGISPGRES